MIDSRHPRPGSERRYQFVDGSFLSFYLHLYSPVIKISHTAVQRVLKRTLLRECAVRHSLHATADPNASPCAARSHHYLIGGSQ
jgi:hypothetical protein